jgi:phosphohistidine swiveling domain-containing protein
VIAILGTPAPGFDVSRAGKKAGNLHLMAVAGFAVPSGFVVFPDEDVSAIDDGALADLVAKVGGFPVAVRSSGLLEDLAGASFAGQYETFLGVEGVGQLRARIEECRASAKSERVRTYLQKNGLDPAGALVSVLVQRMVDARAAGVGFSIHPITGREEHALVECVRGLGEKLVSGHAAPSRYVLDLATGGIVEVEQGADGAELSKGEAVQVARALLDLQAHFHSPQDIELAIDRAGKLWLLQSRPITRIHWRTDVDELTNADFKDGGISARVCTPMMYSLYRDAFQGSMQRYFETLKLGKGQERWIASYYGRGYWNASAVKRALANVPGFDEEKFDRDLGIQKDYGAAGPHVVPTDARTMLRAAPVAIALEREYRHQLRAVLRFGSRFRRERSKWLDRILAFAQTSDGVFFGDLTRVVRELHLKTEQAYFTTIYNNQNMQSDFKNAIAKLDETTGRPTQLALLMSGLDDIRHMDVQRGFVELHRVAKAHGLASPEWSRALESFLAEHGFHADAELELTCPRWSEDPSRVVAHVERALSAGVEPADPDRTVASQRKQFEDEVRAIEGLVASRLVWRVRFAGFRSRLERARRYLSAREEMREYSTQVYALVRAYVLEAGRRFAKRGDLAAGADVFMLFSEEMIDLAQGALSAPRARETANVRRKLYDGYRDLVPPNELGRGVTVRADESFEGKDVLRGVGCSPGVVEGLVRVVHSLDDAGSLRKGEILVTRFTDPGWTPVLGLVAGVVTEVGGMLSHAAVIGREYGIPAVLNVPGATKALRSGQRVRVDGAIGTVVLLEGAREGAT